MGTSTRNTSKKIKKLLEKNGDILDLERDIPDIYKDVLRSRKTKRYIESGEFTALASGGIVGVGRYLGKAEFEERLIDIGITSVDNMTDIDKTKIIDAILDEIEKDESLMNSLLLEAFKITYITLINRRIESEEVNETEFMKSFLKNVIKFTLKTETEEEIMSINDSQLKKISYQEYENALDEYADNIIEQKFEDVITEYVDRKINEKILVDQIIERLKLDE